MGKPEKLITKQQLEKLYVKERRSVRELATLFSCHITTLRRNLVRNGIKVRTQSEEMTGRKLSPENRAKVIKNLRHFNGGQTGEKNPNWKGGRSWKGRSKETGYVIILIDGKYVPEHRYVVEQYLGKKLSSNQHIHHVNGIKTDNRLENLLVVSNGVHMKLHMTKKHREHLSKKSREARGARFWSTKKL